MEQSTRIKMTVQKTAPDQSSEIKAFDKSRSAVMTMTSDVKKSGQSVNVYRQKTSDRYLVGVQTFSST